MKMLLLCSGAAIILAASVNAQTDKAMQPPPPTETPVAPGDPVPPMGAEDPNAEAPPTPVTNDPDMVPADPSVPRNTNARPGSPANPIIEGGNMTQPPAPRDHYPMCSKSVQDHCMQPSDAPRGYARKKR